MQGQIRKSQVSINTQKSYEQTSYNSQHQKVEHQEKLERGSGSGRLGISQNVQSSLGKLKYNPQQKDQQSKEYIEQIVEDQSINSLDKTIPIRNEIHNQRSTINQESNASIVRNNTSRSYCQLSTPQKQNNMNMNFGQEKKQNKLIKDPLQNMEAGNQLQNVLNRLNYSQISTFQNMLNQKSRLYVEDWIVDLLIYLKQKVNQSSVQKVRQSCSQFQSYLKYNYQLIQNQNDRLFKLDLYSQDTRKRLGPGYLASLEQLNKFMLFQIQIASCYTNKNLQDLFRQSFQSLGILLIDRDWSRKPQIGLAFMNNQKKNCKKLRTLIIKGKSLTDKFPQSMNNLKFEALKELVFDVEDQIEEHILVDVFDSIEKYNTDIKLIIKNCTKVRSQLSQELQQISTRQLVLIPAVQKQQKKANPSSKQQDKCGRKQEVKKYNNVLKQQIQTKTVYKQSMSFNSASFENKGGTSITGMIGDTKIYNSSSQISYVTKKIYSEQNYFVQQKDQQQPQKNYGKNGRNQRRDQKRDQQEESDDSSDESEEEEQPQSDDSGSDYSNQ